MAYLVDHLGVHCYYSGQFFFKYERSSRSLTFDLILHVYVGNIAPIFFVFSFFAKNKKLGSFFGEKNLTNPTCEKKSTLHLPTQFFSFFGCKLH